MYLKAVVLLSFFSFALCCPYIVQPSSLNVSQGTTAQFSVVVCRNPLPIITWTVDNFRVFNGNNIIRGVSVSQQILNGNSIRSTLFVSTNSRNFAMITSTVFAPQSFISDPVRLRVQGLLNAVNNLNYDRINQQLSWRPPFTLSGVPILHYRININSDTNIFPAIITNSTTLYLNGTACGNYTATIRAVNAVGEGQAASLEYTHIGAPEVRFKNYTRTIKNDTFTIEVFYEISYNCTEQIPVTVHAVTRNVYGNIVTYHSNQSVIRDGTLTGNVLSGSYRINELLSENAYVGQLVFKTKQGLTVKTKEFKLYTVNLTKRSTSVHSTSTMTSNGVLITITASSSKAHYSLTTHHSSKAHSTAISNTIPTTTSATNGNSVTANKAHTRSSSIAHYSSTAHSAVNSTVFIISGAVGVILLIIIITIIITLLVILAIKKRKSKNNYI
ncbi:PREDICTED: uncharacterized protein LOC109586471 [Amphimedon queenslandica]|uniref:Fibronectin type-III domain-containing protein n=1 Tax=Amphimedon queenslandica TaxID=400682 RepID=A0AAN0JN65_AMPQE|nr:PREDICTED: uncharacterized protein LOC109586471 [Amphimedon queenslandica]|eukprot:XP_019858222.1 PREDICTED: uncharacterized protein LOC109586471 [Amphimedon queenslandica]